MRKIIPFISVGVIIIVFLIGIIFFTKTSEINILSYLRNYNVSSVVGMDDYINISLLINDKNSYITDESQLEYAILSTKDNSEFIKLDLKSVTNKKEIIEYQDENYYMYSFNFKLLLEIEEEYKWYIDDAYLDMGYQGNKKYKIRIGQFSFNKYIDKESKIKITTIKPLTFEKNNSYLGGVIYGIQNYGNKAICIKKVEILNNNIAIGDDVKIIDNSESIDFEEVAGYDHDFLNKRENDINVYINANEQIKVLIPIYYNYLFIMNKFPIKIIYSYDNNLYEYIFGMYNYYNPIKEEINKDNYMVYKVL